MSMLRWTPEQLDAYQKRLAGQGVRKVVFGTEPTNKGGKRKQAVPRKLEVPTLVKEKKKWDYEGALATQLVNAGITGFEREYPWLEGRKYRADLAFPTKNIIVEIEGGAHRIKGRFLADIRKSQDAVTNGWWLLRVSTRDVITGEALSVIKRVLK